ncbi:hypothetical protein Pmani_023343 [Petrolisthes manimaculis]|uniref:Uncharacterized protein n=1 Tax=Petrolisthes manimaculis TaxID=1843537 RepID=A0AAE1PB96_9EUCA|nr:hypothetical protein Pmani_023343 [Petrolisthes manimaculis]
MQALVHMLSTQHRGIVRHVAFCLSSLTDEKLSLHVIKLLHRGWSRRPELDTPEYYPPRHAPVKILTT